MTPNEKTIGRYPLLACLGLLAATIIVYINSFDGSFHSDDYIIIQSNPEIEHPEYFWRFPPHYRQWLTASFALNFAQGGLDPWGYHVVNLVLHLITACLLIGLVHFTLLKGLGWESKAAHRVAFFTGTLFALHPVHTETVTYISGRGSGLSSLFYLGALLLFAVSQSQKTSRRNKIFAIIFIFLFGFGALLSKETSITLPLGFLVYDLCFIRGSAWIPRAVRWKWIYLPMVAGAVLLFLSSPTLKVQAAHWLGRIHWNGMMDQIPVLAHAFKLLLLPFNLTFDYDFPQTTFLSGFVWAASTFFWAILIVTALKLSKQSPPVLTFAIFWFLITLSPTNSILPRIDLLSERNLYLPSIGLCWWVGMLLNSLFEKKVRFPLARLTMIALLVIAVCFGLLTHSRNEIYNNDISLWRDTLNKSPDKSEVHYYLAMAHYLAGDLAGSRRELDRLTLKDPSLVSRLMASPEASQRQIEQYLALLDELKQMVQSDPDRFKIFGKVYQELAGLFQSTAPLYFTRLLLGAKLADEGKLKMAEAEFRQAHAARPHLPHAHLDLATLFVKKGLLDLAFKETEKARNKIHLVPELQSRWHLTRSRILLNQGKILKSRQEAKYLLATDTKDNEKNLLLADIEIASGNVEGAIDYWNQVVDPPELKAEALFKVGMAHVNQNRFKEAIEALSESLSLKPDKPAAQFNLAKLIIDHGGDLNLARHHLKALLNSALDAPKKQMVESLLSQIPEKNEPR